MEREDWEGFWRHWARRIGVYGVVVYLALRHKPEASYDEIAEMAGISYRQVLRAVQSLAAYNLVLVRPGAGWKKTEMVLLDPVDWFVRPAEFPPFPEPVTCERHYWGRDDNDRRCHNCGLLKAEDDYQRMGGYNLTSTNNAIIDTVNKGYLDEARERTKIGY